MQQGLRSRPTVLAAEKSDRWFFFLHLVIVWLPPVAAAVHFSVRCVFCTIYYGPRPIPTYLFLHSILFLYGMVVVWQKFRERAEMLMFVADNLEIRHVSNKCGWHSICTLFYSERLRPICILAGWLAPWVTIGTEMEPS